MNTNFLLTLIKALATKDLDIVVANIELPPIDIDVMLYEAQENGEIEIDKEKNHSERLHCWYKNVFMVPEKEW